MKRTIIERLAQNIRDMTPAALQQICETREESSGHWIWTGRMSRVTTKAAYQSRRVKNVLYPNRRTVSLPRPLIEIDKRRYFHCAGHRERASTHHGREPG